jgi:hypothetical protein
VTQRAHRPWEKDDNEIVSWLEQNGADVHIACWNVHDGEEGDDNGWTVECHDEEIGKGLTLRMAVSDAIHHPERLDAARRKNA